MLIINLTSNKHIMKLIYKLFIAIAILLTPKLADAQINVFSFKVLDQYLKDGKILIKNAETTEIKIEVKFSTARDAQGKPKVGKIRTALGTKNSNGDIVYLSEQQEVFNTDFVVGEVYLTKTYTVNIDKSKLTNSIIDLLQQQPGGLPTESPTRYNYVLEGTTPPDQPEPIDPSHLAKIQAMGFSISNVKNFSTVHYLVEDDILINKSALNAINPIYALNNDKEHNVNIWVRSAVVENSIWADAILLAVGAWNANPNSDVKLHLVRQYGTLDTPPPYDILIDSDRGFLSANQAKAVEYPVGNGKTGGFIMANLDYNFSSTTQATNNIIHAIGHCLSLKHKTDVNSIMVNNNLSNYSQAFPSSADNSVISSLYPLNSSSVVIPYISGIANLSRGDEQSYDMSYYVPGANYSWRATGATGPVPDFSWASEVRLPEVYFDAGNYQLKCTVSIGKYTTPVTVTKSIVVQ
jgi:hypothetical protein